MGVEQSQEEQTDGYDQERQKIVDILASQGYTMRQAFDHPTFGRLILSDSNRRDQSRKHVYIREYEVANEEQGMLLYQYLLRQEQQENTAFLRVYSHFLKPVKVPSIYFRPQVM